MNNSTIYQTLYLESLISLRTIYPASIVWVVTGSIATITNLMLILMLWRQKREKSYFELNMLHLAIADSLIGVSLIISGSKRIFCLVTEIGDLSTQFKCAVEVSFMNFAILSSVFQIFCIAFDRLFAVLKPIMYHKKQNPKKFQLLNMITWFLSFFIMAIAAYSFQIPVPLNSGCILYNIFRSSYNFTFMTSLAVIILIVIIIYLIIFRTVQLRLKRLEKANGNVEAAKDQMETNVLSSVAFFAAFYFFVGFCVAVITQVVTIISSPTQARAISPYLNTACGLTSGSSLFFYLWKNQRVRRDFIAFYFQRKLQTIPRPLVGSKSLV